MSALNFATTTEEFDLVVSLAERAEALCREIEFEPDNRMTIVMDLILAHRACPLDLAGLLKAARGDFAHDYGGIRRHINRETGELEGGFTPRYALSNRVVGHG